MMTESEILELIANDEWMMTILRLAEEQKLVNWCIGAGFVRNRIWNHLHGFDKDKVNTSDIDFVYFDLNKVDLNGDKELSKQLKEETGCDWEIVNQAYAHTWNGLPPYTSLEDALSRWPETATGLGVYLDKGELKLIAPYGIDDLVNLIVRPSPQFPEGIEKVKTRIAKKRWLEKWPKLRFSDI
jgi:hypothetical protein